MEGANEIVISVSHSHLGGLGPAILESVLASAYLNLSLFRCMNRTVSGS